MEGQFAVFASIPLLLNSRFGCLMTLVHASALVWFHNMRDVRPYALRYFTWKYKNGVPINKVPSPCLLYKEHDEEKLHFDKSNAFNATFTEGQKTWECGIEYAAAEVALSAILFVVLTLYHQDNENEFENKYRHLFKKEIELEESGALIKPAVRKQKMS